MLSCEELNRKRAIFLEQNLMNFLVLTEKDDLIKLHVEGIAGDVLDDSRETLVLRQLFEVNGIVGREIFVFRFNACEKKEKETFDADEIHEKLRNSPWSFAFIASFGILRNWFGNVRILSSDKVLKFPESMQ